MAFLPILVLLLGIYILPPILAVVFYKKSCDCESKSVFENDSDGKWEKKHKDYRFMAIAMVIITAIVWIPMIVGMIIDYY